MSSSFVGSESNASVPPISGMEEVLEVTTGVPQAIASNRGMPKLSLNDVYKKQKNRYTNEVSLYWVCIPD